MYVYIQSEPVLWTVGFYAPNGEWNAESDHSSTEAAAQRVHWLNGGGQEKEYVPSPIVAAAREKRRSTAGLE
jgi:hypothetical protein